ncbi:unnamed protein product, partial [Boreogadus saida]
RKKMQVTPGRPRTGVKGYWGEWFCALDGRDSDERSGMYDETWREFADAVEIESPYGARRVTG